MTSTAYKSIHEAFNHARAFPIIKTPEGHNKGTYTACLVTLEEDGSFKAHDHTMNPCWGFLRNYEGKSTRPDDKWPNDLRREGQLVTNEGERIALSVKWGNIKKDALKQFNEEVALNPEVSPWRTLLKDVEVVSDDQDVVGALLFKDLTIDPTFLVSFLRTNVAHRAKQYVEARKEFPEASHIEAFLLSLFRRDNGWVSNPFYSLNPKFDLRRFVNGDPIDLSNGRTFADKEDYNRPEVDFVFGGRPSDEGFRDIVNYNVIGNASDRLAKIRELLQ